MYLDDKFLGSVVLEERKIKSFNCQEAEKTTYRIYVTSDLVVDAFVSAQAPGFNPIDFYNEKRKSGDISIKPVGIFRKIKFGFINFGLKIAGNFY